MKGAFLIFAVLFGLMPVACRSYPAPAQGTWSGESPSREEAIAVPPDSAKTPVASTDNSATDRRKVVATHFSAAELIREKIMVAGKEEFRMILRGDATIIHDKTTLKSPTIILDPGSEGHLIGGVTVIDSEQGMVLHAKEGYYSRSKEIVRLSGSPHFEFKQKDQKPILATTAEIHRDLAENITTLDGDVRMHGEKWSLLADRGVYSDASGILHLSSEPVLIGKDIFMSGGDVDYSAKERAVILRHRPWARMFVLEGAPGASKSPGMDSRKRVDPLLLKKVQEKKATPAEIETLKQQYEQQKSSDTPAATQNRSPGSPVPYDLSAERIEYRFGDETEARLIGDVQITSKVRSIRGNEFRLSGPGLSVLESEQPFQMVDSKEGMEVKASRMRYDTRKRWIWLSGKPVITMKEKDGQRVKAVLEAAVIERDMEKEIIQARGNVHVRRRTEEALAEVGVFREKEQTMDLSGRPYLNRNGTWVSCKKVRMYSNPNRIVFEEDFSGGAR